MRILFLILLAADLMLGVWILWGEPQDGAHEPLRAERQMQPAKLRVVGEPELARLRQKAAETPASETGSK